MGDVVVTVPKALWFDWIDEGDAVGEEPTGEEWGFYTYMGGRPDIQPGERVYVVAHDRLRGYAPLTRLVFQGRAIVFCRAAGAVAVTIPEPIRGFQGWKYRWWDRAAEVPFPEWRKIERAPKREKVMPALPLFGAPDSKQMTAGLSEIVKRFNPKQGGEEGRGC